MRRSCAIACFLLLCFASCWCADDFANAMRLIASGKTAEGMAAMEQLAEAGNVDAALLLGRAYSHPNATVKEPDYQRAMKWLSVASDKGSGEATALIAEMYEQGHGVPKSATDAMVWSDRAASQGWDQQEVDLRCFVLTKADEPLTCKPNDPRLKCPTPAEMDLLREAGVKGSLQPNGGGGRDRLGPKTRVVLVLDHPVSGEVRLKQPRRTRAIYVQRGDEWDRLPADVAVIDRPIIVKAQEDKPRRITAGVQDVDGSVSSYGCGSWK